MKPPGHNIHDGCNYNPKGFLRRLTIPNGNGMGKPKTTQYFICDYCNTVVHLLQVELK